MGADPKGHVCETEVAQSCLERVEVVIGTEAGPFLVEGSAEAEEVWHHEVRICGELIEVVAEDVAGCNQSVEEHDGVVS